jgi:signal transduction histidine kinase
MEPSMEDKQPAISDPQGSDELNHAYLVQLRWFSFIGVLEIRLRWFAAAGVLIGTWILDTVLDLPIPGWPLYAIGVCMFIYNYLLHRYLERRFTYPTRVSGYDYEGLLRFYWRGIEREGIAEAASFDRFVQVQLSLDWLAMILLVHFTGGVASPLLFFFIFHLIVAAALLSRSACYFFATVAVVAVTSLALLEYANIIPHYSIGLVSESVHHSGLYVAAILFQFITSMYMTVYLATTLTKFLRQRDEQMLRLQQSLSDAYQLIQTLYNVTRTVSSTLDLQEVLDLVAQSAAEAMQVRACSIKLMNKTGTLMDTVASFGLSDQHPDAGPIDPDLTNYVSQTLATGQPTIVRDTSKEDGLVYPESARDESIASVLCVPLLIRNRAEGVICVYSDQPGHFIQRDAEYLAALASAGATAVENARSYEALQSADRAKSDFVRMVTHEFRSPLSAVQSMLRLLDLGIVEPLGEKQRDLVERSQRRISHLLALVNDLLELAAGKMEPLQGEKHKVDLSDIVAKVSEVMQPRAVEKGLHYDVDLGAQPLLLAGFEDSLERMIMNLVSNAVKYTPSGGTVRLRARSEQGEIKLKVSDTGIGIPEEAMSRIFTEFYRAKNAKSTNVDGTGLGLAIVKDVVEQHGGRISVRSRVGEGTTFSISLPQE